MSRDDVGEKIIMPMMITYLPPRAYTSEEQRIALEAYFMALQRFDAEILEAAWNSVVASTRGRAWPVPGVFVAAAASAARERREERRAAEKPRSIVQDRDDHWRRVCLSAKAQRAAELGVAWSLKVAILDDGKTLEEIDLQRLVAGRDDCERTADRVRANKPLYRNGRNVGVMDAALREQTLSWYEAKMIAEARVVAEIVEANRKSGGVEHVAQEPSQTT